MKLRAALGSSALLLVFGCTTPISAPPPPVVPAWHSADAGSFAVGDDERALWKHAEERHAELGEDELLIDAALDAYLAKVLRAVLPEKLAAGAPTPRAYVVRSTDFQAGAAANGSVYLSLGLLAAIENEAQLAALLGHELGHFLARHALVDERYRAVSRSTVERANLSRQQELEADLLGLELMRAAAYDPRQMPRLLTLMREQDRASRTPHYAWESHPYVDVRVARLSTLILPSEAGAVNAESYEAALAESLALAAKLELDERMLTRAKATLARYQRLRPESARGFYLKAEVLRLGPEGRSAPEVRAAYERAVELAPSDPDALRALGILCRSLGDSPCATKHLRRYLEVAPDAPDRELLERQLGDVEGS